MHVNTSSFRKTEDWRNRPVQVEDFLLPAHDAGIRLYVRNKHVASMRDGEADPIVVCIHGSSSPGHVLYDTPLEGYSWMDYLAAHGKDVYVFDIRGYGKSTRPVEMLQDPNDNSAIVDGETALRDISAVVDFVLARRQVTRLAMIGWSWGTDLAGRYATENAEKVERLVLFGPVWVPVPAPPNRLPDKIPAYRILRDRDRGLAQWLSDIPDPKRQQIVPPAWSQTLFDTIWSSDPLGATADPPFIRVPSGAIKDWRDYWLAGKPFYDPAKILAPVLVAVAEWDSITPTYMAQTLFALLVNSPAKQYICFGEGTHYAPFERHRLNLFAAIQTFLERVG
ncbi:Lysophospholipase, alpha-beta hydrolase superfamily [Bradyrhizobium shewense]|uniref:Lysophospholipase, alpha-beta hydrolase superfamily n=1 Tax=Bradyrhizobium shewense TaxID=1761772 RepID=A0A1C3XUY6_9BRAD|nr:alpha/beta fold hydrolase [Bradyrhizobium shewense]SCB55824.1 Lysophospholipase, alpha-beta hydrolase superfamily [Bradyrhizobium shewense]